MKIPRKSLLPFRLFASFFLLHLMQYICSSYSSINMSIETGKTSTDVQGATKADVGKINTALNQYEGQSDFPFNNIDEEEVKVHILHDRVLKYRSVLNKPDEDAADLEKENLYLDEVTSRMRLLSKNRRRVKTSSRSPQAVSSTPLTLLCGRLLAWYMTIGPGSERGLTVVIFI